MHACGHDMHMTCAIGVASVLAALKDHWKGTLVFIGQPAEEIGAGARMMLDAGLFQKFPQAGLLPWPCTATPPARTARSATRKAWPWPTSIRWTSPCAARAATGRPRTRRSIPIVLAARIVLDLQTLVSRETNPTDPAVVTVGSIHGGTKHNIIPDEVKLQLTVRTTKDCVRKHLLDGIKRIAEGGRQGRRRAGAGGHDRAEDEFTPALYNDPALTRKTVAVFKEVLGEDKVAERPPVLGGEDFCALWPGGRAGLPVLAGHGRAGARGGGGQGGRQAAAVAAFGPF